jgi:acyl-CoA thioesterase-1
MYPDLAEKLKVALIPFLLEGVGGVPRLNLPDGIHPTAEGHKIVAETVWRTLEPLL